MGVGELSGECVWRICWGGRRAVRGVCLENLFGEFVWRICRRAQVGELLRPSILRRGEIGEIGEIGESDGIDRNDRNDGNDGNDGTYR